jgi:hypothetical protein
MGPVVADIGLRNFAEINSTLSSLTGVPTSNTAASGTYLSVQQQLPSTYALESFSSADQVGIAQLAIQYCNSMVNTPSLVQQMFGTGFTISGSTYPGSTGAVASALATAVLGTGINSSPASTTVTNELTTLITTLCNTTSCSSTARAQAVTAAACAAAFGSADMLIK